MAARQIDIQVNYFGRSPVVSGDKRTTLINLCRLIRSRDHGSGYNLGGNATVSQNFVNVTESVVSASATVTAAGVQAADTVTLNGVVFTAAQFRASGTITAASAQAGDTVTVNGVVFTAVSGSPVGNQFDISSTDTAAATSLAAAINACTDPAIRGLIEASSAAAVCTIYAKSPGTFGNNYTLASSNNTRLAKSGANLANGAALTNNHFDYIGTNNETAASIAGAINSSTTANAHVATATVASAVVTVTAKLGGTAGNTITWVSSNGTRLAVTGSGDLAGGSQGATTRWYF